MSLKSTSQVPDVSLHVPSDLQMFTPVYQVSHVSLKSSYLFCLVETQACYLLSVLKAITRSAAIRILTTFVGKL
eukprot:6185446-Heterocapsa_arctica.AAC.1